MRYLIDNTTGDVTTVTTDDDQRYDALSAERDDGRPRYQETGLHDKRVQAQYAGLRHLVWDLVERDLVILASQAEVDEHLARRDDERPLYEPIDWEHPFVQAEYDKRRGGADLLTEPNAQGKR